MPSSLLTDIGSEAAALGAIVVAVGLVAKSKPVRWLWRRTVTTPLSTWFREQVRHEIEPVVATVYAELKPNGGSSLRDRVDAIENRLARWEDVGTST